ncbi:hypothetical protein ACL07V_14175 [Streptomyces sp. MB22_4]|uniref:hypothetical protein n=1 Tax=Streptomyces sp. MB22_4 TaxID=3383120 RepID=UPI00399FC60D
MTPSPSSHDFDRNPPSAGSPLARDRGLRRTRRLTRWLAVTAVAATAALGGLYTHLIPGGASPPATPPASGQSPNASSAPAGGDDDEGGSDDEEEAAATKPVPRAPAQPPASTRQKPHTTTGAS